MGESPCLVRSFSHPSSDASRKQGDPIRALTESVSFGRFMSEFLAWEKFSTFSHNRYLEEAEQFSKPGTVAEKKAFFEAHFKQRAAMKSAALAEESKPVASAAFQTRTTNGIANDSSNTSLENANIPVAITEKQDTNVSENEVADSGDASECNPSVERDNLANLECQAATEQDLTEVENSKHQENAGEENMDLAKPDKRIVHKESADNSTSSSKKRRTSSSSKSSSNSKASPLPLADGGNASQCNPSVETDNLANLEHQAATEQNLTQVENSKHQENAAEENMVLAKPNKRIVHKVLAADVLSISVASSYGGSSKRLLKMAKNGSTQQNPTRTLQKAAGKENLVLSGQKRPSNPRSKSSTHGGTSKRQLPPARQATTRIGNSDAFVNKKSAGDSNKTERMISKSPHMSINFASCANETSKTSRRMPRDLSAPPRAPTKASVTAERQHPSKVLPSEDRCCSESSNPSGSRAQPFNFRSEERAAKRKEFFQKLEEKLNSKEIEKVQMPTQSKGKAKNLLNTFRHSTDLKAKPTENLSRGSVSPNNHMKKIPLTRPQSPKLGRKSSPKSGPDASSRPPQRPSINTTTSKGVIQRSNRTTCLVRMNSLAKNRHENASPNIQPSVVNDSTSHRQGRVRRSVNH